MAKNEGKWSDGHTRVLKKVKRMQDLDRQIGSGKDASFASGFEKWGIPSIPICPGRSFDLTEHIRGLSG
jgi:hypothetical protein